MTAKSAGKSPAKLQAKTPTREEDDNLTPRSSMLYQTDEEVSEQIHDDDDQDCEQLSVAEDENL